MLNFEQGPIRPPSEAGSLLVRVSRNCPWNRCAFCSVYKGTRFSLRTVEEVLADLDAMKEMFGDRPRTVFLQDANPMLTRPDELVAIVEGIRERFPNVTRITAYARSHTLARRSLEDLTRIRKTGVDRLHVGLESGCDAVLKLVDKGTNRAEQIKAGRRAKEAGFELSEYVMPGLGGQKLWESHADESASALVVIQPDFIRLRTAVVVPTTPLAEMASDGRFSTLDETEIVREIRRFLVGLEGLETRIESDHSLNLLMGLRGDLPADLNDLIALCDQYLGFSRRKQQLFVLARRLGRVATLQRFEDHHVGEEMEPVLAQLEDEGVDPLALSDLLRRQLV